MTGTTSRRRRAAGRDRDHQFPGRPRQIKIRYTDTEYATIAQAAREAGLTPTGYAAEAALATARGTATPTTTPWRVALLELADARTQLRRIGTNLNQATRAINTTGEPPQWLDRVLAMTERAITRLDDAAVNVVRGAPAGRARARQEQNRPTAND